MQMFTFRIRRYDPAVDGAEPRGQRWDEYALEMESTGAVLDALIRIKDTLDGTLTFRRSCAHGICGSCAMMINGLNRLACQTLMKDLPRRVRVEPLPALPPVKDLVVDMSGFFERNDMVMPYMVNNEPPPERERLQSPAEQGEILESITCIMCSSCTNACPSFWARGEYLGPAALLKAYRYIFDSRDRAAAQRLDRITEAHGLWRCHSIFNCTAACPKGIDVANHILRLKRAAVKGQ